MIKDLIQSVPASNEFIEDDFAGYIAFTMQLIELITDEDSANQAIDYLNRRTDCMYAYLYPRIRPKEATGQMFRIFAKCCEFVKRDKLFAEMSKSCPGCGYLNLILCARYNRSLIPEIEALLRKLLGDTNRILIEPGEIAQTADEVEAYCVKEGHDPNYSIGNCLHFHEDEDLHDEIRLNGLLLTSEEIPKMM